MCIPRTSQHCIERCTCVSHGGTGCHHLITKSPWCVWARISRRKCVFIKPGLGSVKDFNPLHTACLLLINETAKEEDTEPNTVSKDRGHVGTCRQLCHSNSLCPHFQAGRQYATFAHHLAGFFFFYLQGDTLPISDNAQLHRPRGQGAVQRQWRGGRRLTSS